MPGEGTGPEKAAVITTPPSRWGREGAEAEGNNARPISTPPPVSAGRRGGAPFWRTFAAAAGAAFLVGLLVRNAADDTPPAPLTISTPEFKPTYLVVSGAWAIATWRTAPTLEEATEKSLAACAQRVQKRLSQEAYLTFTGCNILGRAISNEEGQRCGALYLPGSRYNIAARFVPANDKTMATNIYRDVFRETAHYDDRAQILCVEYDGRIYKQDRSFEFGLN